MRLTLILPGLLLVACSEPPRPQPKEPVPDAPDLSSSTPADLTGADLTGADLALPTLAITSISPKSASTVGRDRVTIGGSGFDLRTEVFFNGTRADIESVAPGQLVALAPAGLPWGVPVTVSVRRDSDGARAQNSTAANSSTAFSFSSSSIDFRLRDRLNHSQNSGTRGFQLGDFNKDGRIDLANLFNANASNVHLNNGAGGLIYTGSQDNIWNNQSTYKSVAVDLDGDGAMDIVSTQNSYWGYMLSDPVTGRLNRNTNYYSAGGCTSVQAVAAALINNDAQPDVAVACNGQTMVGLWMSTNTAATMFGGTNAAHSVTLSTPSAAPSHVTFADLDKTGPLDLVAISAVNNVTALYQWLNKNNTFADADRSAVGTNGTQGSNWVTCKDLNGDGYADCVTTDFNTNTARVFLNNGAGVLQAPNANGTISVGFNPWEVAIEDVNGDGFQDLVVNNFSSSNIDIIPGRGDGTFGNVVAADGRVLVSRTILSLNCRLGRNVQFADLDGDGIKEMAASCESGENNVSNQGATLIFKNVSR